MGKTGLGMDSTSAEQGSSSISTPWQSDVSERTVDLFTREPRDLCLFLKRNYREIVVMGLATLALALNHYHSIENQWVDALVYYAALPILAIVVLLRKNPLDFGFRLGNYRLWLLHVGVFAAIGLPVLFAVSPIASLGSFYELDDFNFLEYFIETAAYLFAWEFLYRGFLLFGLRERLGEASILVQMIPFVLRHLHKPELEALSTIPMGLYFGYVAYRSNSYWPAFIIHMFINVSFRAIVNL